MIKGRDADLFNDLSTQRCSRRVIREEKDIELFNIYLSDIITTY